MKILITPWILFGVLLLFADACTMNEDIKRAPSIERASFGMIDDRELFLYTLQNANGLILKVTNYGGIVTSLFVPDRKGVFQDIVLGFDSLSGYQNVHPYFGAIIGRYGNRIANGRFELDGNSFELARNNGENHLHGGIKGFDKVIWEATEIKEEGYVGLTLSYLSKADEEGYPGNLQVNVTYKLTNDNSWEIYYSATSDAKTVINLTQHSYFNLGNSKDILNHELLINGNHFLPVNAGLIPTGERRPVSGTPFDFTSQHLIGERINLEEEQLLKGGGYDHCWILNSESIENIVAEVYDSESGIFMEVFTTEPGLQFYTGNFLDGSLIGKGNEKYNQRYGFCLETQHFPDSPNHPDFPSTLLEPGNKYESTTIYKFSTK